MSDLALYLIIFVVSLVVFGLLGVPIAFTLGLVGIIGLLLFEGGVIGLRYVSSIAWQTTANFLLVALPLYIFMGENLVSGGVGKDLYNIASKWLNRLPGSLGMGTIGACTVFGAMTGSAIACAATIGTIALPEMKRHHYDIKLGLGCVAAGGTLANLIPPSNPMITYAVMTGASLGTLFIAGIVPGIVLALMFMCYVGYVAVAKPGAAPRVEAVTWRERFSALRTAWSPILVILAVLGSIYLGVVTPTEAAAAGAFVSLVILFARGRFNMRPFAESLLSTVSVTCMVIMLMIGALIVGHVFISLGITQVLSQLIISTQTSPWVAIAVLYILCLIIGAFLDAPSVIFITVPILWPVFQALGFDVVWFGIQMVVLTEIGCISPPVGVTMFVVQGIAKASSSDAMRATLPFCLVGIIALVIFSIFPSVILWLPSTMK